mmetsp:Transcript_10039/g.37228  ORF Transcript_10039/g.37228 Transcript_10039/m.37228 type:complete len:319 (-) Transcript_10039:1161-2117(-)
MERRRPAILTPPSSSASDAATALRAPFISWKSTNAVPLALPVALSITSRHDLTAPKTRIFSYTSFLVHSAGTSRMNTDAPRMGSAGRFDDPSNGGGASESESEPPATACASFARAAAFKLFFFSLSAIFSAIRSSLASSRASRRVPPRFVSSAALSAGFSPASGWSITRNMTRRVMSSSSAVGATTGIKAAASVSLSEPEPSSEAESSSDPEYTLSSSESLSSEDASSLSDPLDPLSMSSDPSDPSSDPLSSSSSSLTSAASASASAFAFASAYVCFDSAQSTATGRPAIETPFTKDTAFSACAFFVYAANANPLGFR